MKIIQKISLAHTPKGTITVAHITEPYGEESHPVVSIGVSPEGDVENPTWKAHIPYENIDDVIDALEEALNRFGN